MVKQVDGCREWWGKVAGGVNGDPPFLPMLFELALRELRGGLHRLSESRFPGLRARHYRLLGFVPAKGVRPARLAEVGGLTKQALAQSLTPLLDGGYLDVVPDPADRRARVLLLTGRGREVLAAVRAVEAEYERAWGERVGAERWSAARAVLLDLFDG